MRYLWNREKHVVAPWWQENSKEAYPSVFEALARAFHDHFASRDEAHEGQLVA
jgi:putative transposase